MEWASAHVKYNEVLKWILRTSTCSSCSPNCPSAHATCARPRQKEAELAEVFANPHVDRSTGGGGGSRDVWADRTWWSSPMQYNIRAPAWACFGELSSTALHWHRGALFRSLAPKSLRKLSTSFGHFPCACSKQKRNIKVRVSGSMWSLFAVLDFPWLVEFFSSSFFFFLWWTPERVLFLVHSMESQSAVIVNGVGGKRKADVDTECSPPLKQADSGSRHWDKATIMEVREKHIGLALHTFPNARHGDTHTVNVVSLFFFLQSKRSRFLLVGPASHSERTRPVLLRWERPADPRLHQQCLSWWDCPRETYVMSSSSRPASSLIGLGRSWGRAEPWLVSEIRTVGQRNEKSRWWHMCSDRCNMSWAGALINAAARMLHDQLI